MSPLPQVTQTAITPADNHESRQDGDEDGHRKFNERQKAHFKHLLDEKWNCEQEGHTVCVPTEDGQHFELSGHHIQEWVDALCSGRATTASPPRSLFKELTGGNFNLSTGELSVCAVSVAPSRMKPGPHHRPVVNRARSIDSILDPRPSGRRVGLVNHTSNSSSTSSSSGTPGPGYFGGKAIKWLGEKGLRTVQYPLIVKRTVLHIRQLQRWIKRRIELRDAREKVFEMLGDAHEMCWTHYSTAVNNHGYAIGRAIYHWLYTYHDVPQEHDILCWHIQVQISLIPILLTRVSRVDPLAGDLAYRTLAVLTRDPLEVAALSPVPLDVQDEDTWTVVIGLISRELAYTKCTFRHSWLGIWFLRIVEMSLRVRNLTEVEIDSIKELAVRRQQQRVDYNAEEEDIWRPWEVALFAQCVSQGTVFKDAVLDAHGLPSLVAALDSMLSEDLRVWQIKWEDVAITLRVLAFLSEKEWVAAAVDSVAIRSLFQVFRRSIPERWFCIRFWAADTMRNMVVYRPRLARYLLQEGADSAFETLSKPKIDHELSTDQFQPRLQDPVQVPPVPPMPATPTLSATPSSNTSSPTSTSPPHTPNLFLPLTSTDKPLSPWPPSPVTGPSSPTTSSAGTVHRRSSMWSKPSLPPLMRSSLAGIRHDRGASTDSSREVTPSVRFRPGNDLSRTLTTPLNPRPSPSLIPTSAQERLFEEYKEGAKKRAKELLEHLRKWTEYTPDALPTLEALPPLEVSGAGVGWFLSCEVEE